ncbi:MAG TPA: hypothetical protein PK760_15705, partial [Flavobacteriales bacterium]|nr:hypothetical protein [Flavobacteriales bacterium]
MNNNKLAIAAILCLAVSACKKDADPPPASTTPTEVDVNATVRVSFSFLTGANPYTLDTVLLDIRKVFGIHLTDGDLAAGGEFQGCLTRGSGGVLCPVGDTVLVAQPATDAGGLAVVRGGSEESTVAGFVVFPKL